MSNPTQTGNETPNLEVNLQVDSEEENVGSHNKCFNNTNKCMTFIGACIIAGVVGYLLFK